MTHDDLLASAETGVSAPLGPCELLQSLARLRAPGATPQSLLMTSKAADGERTTVSASGFSFHWLSIARANSMLSYHCSHGDGCI
jgi:hypothetical protein